MARGYTAKAAGSSGGGAPRRRGPFRRWSGPGLWRRGWLLALVAVALGAALFFHSEIPDSIGNLGSLWETVLPWGGLLVPVLLVAGLWRRSPVALLALVLPVAVWLNLFGGQFADKSRPGGNLTVLTHNVSADNPSPARTTQALSRSGADIVALEEVAAGQGPEYDRGLRAVYPYHQIFGTVGVWSRYPLRDSRVIDIKMGWPRAMRTTVATPHGDLAVFAAHLPSVRVQFRAGFTANQRDNAAQLLGDAIAADRTGRAVLLGDLNGTMNDRSLAPITSQLRSAQGAAGDGPGFSWPAAFPMTRIDQIMVRGLDPVSSKVLAPTGSDHRPVEASLEF